MLCRFICRELCLPLPRSRTPRRRISARCTKTIQKDMLETIKLQTNKDSRSKI